MKTEKKTQENNRVQRSSNLKSFSVKKKYCLKKIPSKGIIVVTVVGGPQTDIKN